MFGSIIRRFLYYPTKLRRDAPLPRWAADAVEMWIKSPLGDIIHGLYWKAPAGRPTILFLHGNAQSVFEWSMMREDITQLDCGLLLVDYPGYGKSTGEPNEKAIYAACRAALDRLIADGVPETSIVVHGKSLGGGAATEIVQGRKLLGVILESTFTSIPAVARNLFPFLPAETIIREERYDSVSRMAGISVPVLVVHGDRDDLIPFAEGEALFAAAREPKQFYRVRGAGHNDTAYTAGAEYGLTLRKWLDDIMG